MEKKQVLKNVDIPLDAAIACLFGKTERVDTRLVGREAEEFLILKFPALTGVKTYLQGRRPFAAHVNIGSTNIFFASNIEYTLEKRFLAFCSYPARFNVFDMRDTKRVHCLMPAGLLINNKYYYGVIRDISSTGCQFVLDAVRSPDIRHAHEGDMVTLEMGTAQDTIVFTAEVVHLRQNISRTTLGLSFRFLEEKDIAALNTLIYSLSYNQQ